MTPYRKETKIPSNQPVRFYKIIALSFLIVTVALLGMIVFMSAKRATITIVTKEIPVDTTLLLTVGGGDVQVSGLVTSTQVIVSQKFSPTGNKQEPGVATGEIIIHNDSNTDQPLVATTRFLSSDGVLFRLRRGMVAPAGKTAAAEVYADQEGASGNIGPTRFIIPGLNETRQRSIYGTSEKPMTGGIKTIGVLNQADLDQAEKKLVEEAKKEGQKQLESTNAEGKYAGIFSVTNYEMKSDAELGKELSEYSVTLTATVAGVFYDSEAVQQYAEKGLFDLAVDDAEIIEPSGNLPTVTLESFEADNGNAALSVFYDGVANLNPESKQLAKQMFFGKSRDEIRRYLLSLDHVESVEIKFSPAWMQSAPQVEDHVNVVVKSVR